MSGDWNEQKAMHLLRRTAFAAREEDVEASVRLGKHETVVRLLTGRSLTGQDAVLPSMEQVQIEGKRLRPESITDARLYWIYRMCVTEAPLIEKMVLFWHNHFATSYDKVRDTSLMVRQNELFRRSALGDFRGLVEAISRDPAMMIWLDVNKNRQDAPNENFSREMMELFTLGIGHFTENDVREAARAMTGWHVDRKTGAVQIMKQQHDEGTKTILNQTGRWNTDDFIRILFHRKSLPHFMAEKLLQYFAAEHPTADWVHQVAEHIAADRLISSVLYKLFVSEQFYEPQVRMSLVKSPVDYMIGISRILRLPIKRKYASWLSDMGQNLYSPPNVSGWAGGRSWLTTSNLLYRTHFAEEAAVNLSSEKMIAAARTASSNNSPADWVDLWNRKIGSGSLSKASKQTLTTFIHHMATASKPASMQDEKSIKALALLLFISPEAHLM